MPLSPARELLLTVLTMAAAVSFACRSGALAGARELSRTLAAASALLLVGLSVVFFAASTTAWSSTTS
jgi:hypothetical protein